MSTLIKRLLLASFTFTSPLAAMAADSHMTEKGPVLVESLAEFERPWGMDFISETKLIVTERTGQLWVFDKETGQKTQIRNAPESYVDGQGGLLDVALHPDFERNGWVYFTLSKRTGRGSGTSVVRAKLSDLSETSPFLYDLTTLYDVLPSSASRHFGSRLVFAPDGKLFVTFGDHGDRPRAQDTSNAAGSVVRLNDDGSIPTDNPSFTGTNAREGLWSIGHRNQQGADIHPITGELWTVEHGARGGDEINQPEAGKNYGWPVISYGRHYTGFKIGEGAEKPGLEQPVHYWDPSIAPSGLTIYDGEMFPQWKHNIFVGALKDQKLMRLTMDDDKVVAEEILFEREYGRIRDVRTGKDGALWLLIDSSRGKLLRVTPESR